MDYESPQDIGYCNPLEKNELTGIFNTVHLRR